MHGVCMCMVCACACVWRVQVYGMCMSTHVHVYGVCVCTACALYGMCLCMCVYGIACACVFGVCTCVPCMRVRTSSRTLLVLLCLQSHLEEVVVGGEVNTRTA